MKDRQIKTLTLGGVMAALIFVMTYLPKIPVPATGGYIHLGDGMICLAAVLLGPVSVAAAAVGSALSDLIGGYMSYLLPTFLVKGAMAAVVCALYRPGSGTRAIASFLLAEAVMVLGYFGAECLMFGSSAAIAAIGANVTQGVGGVVVGAVCLPLADRMKKAIRSNA